MNTKLLDKYNPYLSYRIHQKDTIKRLLDAYKEGNKIVSLSSPTASGKTGILYVVGKILEKEYGITKISYTSPQVSIIENGNFFDLPKLVGKSNYTCVSIPGCNADECPFTSREEGFLTCEDCSYRIAKDKFYCADMAVTTMARYLIDPKIYMDTSVLFVDESSDLENELLKKATIELNLDLSLITKQRKVHDQVADLQKYLSEFDIESYLHKRNDELHVMVGKLSKQCKEYRGEVFKSGKRASSAEIKRLKSIQREYNYHHRQETACGHALRYLGLKVPHVLTVDVEEVYNPLLRKKMPTPVPYFKLLDACVPFGDMCASLDFVVLASGTPTAELVTSTYKEIVVPHPIPKERRLIYYDPVGSMNASMREQTAKPMAQRIAQLHDTFNKNTIVHCGSYGIARMLDQHLHTLHDKIVLQDPDFRVRDLKKWQAMDDAIFLSVKYEEGISLDGPKYPMNIVCKCPFPYLGSVWVNRRNELDGWAWYNKVTAVSVMQACGRTTRAPDDTSETWILDSSFGPFYSRSRALWLPWFSEALVWKR